MLVCRRTAYVGMSRQCQWRVSLLSPCPASINDDIPSSQPCPASTNGGMGFFISPSQTLSCCCQWRHRRSRHCQWRYKLHANGGTHVNNSPPCNLF